MAYSENQRIENINNENNISSKRNGVSKYQHGENNGENNSLASA
jgi:hypothetical protein